MYFGQSITDISILRSVVEIIAGVPLRNAHNRSVLDFTMKTFAVRISLSGVALSHLEELNLFLQNLAE